MLLCGIVDDVHNEADEPISLFESLWNPKSEVSTCNVGGAFLPLHCSLCKDTCVTCRVRCWRSYSITTPSTCSWPSQRLL